MRIGTKSTPRTFTMPYKSTTLRYLRTYTNAIGKISVQDLKIYCNSNKHIPKFNTYKKKDPSGVQPARATYSFIGKALTFGKRRRFESQILYILNLCIDTIQIYFSNHKRCVTYSNNWRM